MDVKTKILSSLVGIFSIATIVMSTLLIMGCKTFDPIQIQGQPAECNDFYSVMRYNVKNENKDGAFPATVYAECKEARKLERILKAETHCRDLWFGKDGVIDKTKYDKYTGYLECIK